MRKYIVGIIGPPSRRLRSFATHDEAAAYIAKLPNADQGIYYLDGPEN
jgi:hypothetical protein